MRKTTRFALVALAAAVMLVGINLVSVGRQSIAVTRKEGNTGITMMAYHPYLVNPNGLVLDIWHIKKDETRPVDVFRVFLDIAETMKDRSFSSVQLAHQGRTVFRMDGAYFRTLGQERTTQNPMYTIRTLPQNLQRPDGSRAFQVWEGGLFAVMAKQMDDFSKFAEEWIIGTSR